MPASYDVSAVPPNWSVEDVNKFAKYQYFLTLQEAKFFPYWQDFENLYGSVNWQTNMGTTMRSVSAQPSPIGTQDFYPNPITQLPNVDRFSVLEAYEDATVKMHDYDSNLFSFLQSFQDFRTGQLAFQHKDILNQIAARSNQFIRTVMMQKCPYVCVATDKGPILVDAPIVPYGTDVTSTTAANAKSQAWFAAIAAQCNAGMSLALIDQLNIIAQEDIGIPFFDGSVAKPKDDEIIKGKYVLLTSSEAFMMLKYDPNFSQFRNVNFSIVENGFRGSIFDEITSKMQRLPMRLMLDGSKAAPQLTVGNTNRTVPNPQYSKPENSPIEVGWLLGAGAFKTIKIGPPPSEFANKKMSSDKFYSMQWNGEVKLTDQVLIKNSDGSYQMNSRGRYLQFQGTTIHGCIPVDARYVIPIFYQRRRPSVIV